MSKKNPRTNGDSRREIQDRQHKHGLEQTGAQAAHNQDPLTDVFSEERASYVRELLHTEINIPGMNRRLGNLSDQSFVLGNIDEKQYNEYRWWLKVIKEKIESQFPGPQSGITAEWREYLYDKPEENLEPLTDEQISAIDEYIKGVDIRLSRSVEGFEHKMQSKTIAETRTVSGDNNNSDDESWFSKVF